MKLTHLNPYRLQELRQSLHSVYDHSAYAEPVAFKPIDTFRILSYCSVMHVFMPQNLPASASLMTIRPKSRPQYVVSIWMVTSLYFAILWT